METFIKIAHWAMLITSVAELVTFSFKKRINWVTMLAAFFFVIESFYLLGGWWGAFSVIILVKLSCLVSGWCRRTENWWRNTGWGATKQLLGKAKDGIKTAVRLTFIWVRRTAFPWLTNFAKKQAPRLQRHFWLLTSGFCFALSFWQKKPNKDWVDQSGRFWLTTFFGISFFLFYSPYTAKKIGEVLLGIAKIAKNCWVAVWNNFQTKSRTAGKGILWAILVCCVCASVYFVQGKMEKPYWRWKHLVLELISGQGTILGVAACGALFVLALAPTIWKKAQKSP